MNQEFNLIDEPWICVRTNDCQIKEVSLKDVFLNAHEYTELSGETRTQDFAVFRLMLAVMYTVFSRYDTDGSDYPTEDRKTAKKKWKEIWNSGRIPDEPIERYFEEWHERFWLFDEKYPFYQSNAVNGRGKIYSTAKMIGTLFESANKSRLFSARTEQGRTLSYPEAARWLLHCNCFDDIAAKNPTPKKAWVGRLGLIALKGKNLFETLMLNYCADADTNNSQPSWEQENSVPEFNKIIPVPDNQAALLSLMSRRIYLCREKQSVTGYYISGGNYFEDDEVFQEQMTLWRGYQEKKNAPVQFKPKLYDVSKKAWQDFASIAVLADIDKQNDAEKQFRKAGVLEWLCKLLKWKVVDKNYLVTVNTAAVIYDYGQATSLPVIDNVSDSLRFHSELLLEVGHVWRSRILEEIEKCDKVADKLASTCRDLDKDQSLFTNLQRASGRIYNKKSKKDTEDRIAESIYIKTQFYSKIDRPFRLWLAELNPEIHEIQDYSAELEKQILKIALDFGNELASQSGSHAIFGHYSKQNPVSSAQALTYFEYSIRNILKLAGEKDE